MRIAIVQEEIDLQRGGAETSTVEMARQLGRLDLEVTLIWRYPLERAPRPGNEPAWLPTSRLEPEEPNLLHVPVLCSGGTRAARTRSFVARASAACRAGRYDLVHAVTPCPVADVYQPRGGTYAETIRRSTALHTPWLRPLKRLGRRLNLRQQYLRGVEAALLARRERPVHLAAVSDYVRRQALACGVAEERVRVIFNGVDPPAEAPVAAAAPAEPAAAGAVALRGSPAPLVLFAAHNFRLKGLRELLQAMAAFPAAWRLAVVGRDDPVPYRQQARRLGVAGRVQFAGPAASLGPWYARASALAHPTWYDPCSRVVLEALLHGLPIVTTRWNGAAEVMIPGRHGAVIAEPTDLGDLAAGIAMCLSPALQAACAADVPRLRGELAMARHARELKSYYEEILAARAGARAVALTTGAG